MEFLLSTGYLDLDDNFTDEVQDENNSVIMTAEPSDPSKIFEINDAYEDRLRGDVARGVGLFSGLKEM